MWRVVAHAVYTAELRPQRSWAGWRLVAVRRVCGLVGERHENSVGGRVVTGCAPTPRPRAALGGRRCRLSGMWRHVLLILANPDACCP